MASDAAGAALVELAPLGAGLGVTEGDGARLVFGWTVAAAGAAAVAGGALAGGVGVAVVTALALAAAVGVVVFAVAAALAEPVALTV